jgi:hypothetical protein
MVRFRLDPERFWTLDEAWGLACSRLGGSDELAQSAHDLGDRIVKLSQQVLDLDKRSTDERVTAEERAAAKAELAVVNDELDGAEPLVLAEQKRVDFERLMRDALADGPLDTFIGGPDSQPIRLGDREAWRPKAFGRANIGSIPDLGNPSFNPGPDTGGQDAHVEKSAFDPWLDAVLPETRAPDRPQPTEPEPVEPAVAYPTVAATDAVPADAQRLEPDAPPATQPVEPAVPGPTIAATEPEPTDIEHTRWQREPTIRALKVLHPPDGIPPKGTSSAALARRINKLPEFTDSQVSDDTVYRALKDIKTDLETRKK